MFSRSSHAWHASEFRSFSRLNNIPLYVGWWDFKLSVTLYALEPHLGNMFCRRIRDAGDPHGGTHFPLGMPHLSYVFSTPPCLSSSSFTSLSFFLSFSFFLSSLFLSLSLSRHPSLLPFLPILLSFTGGMGRGPENFSFVLEAHQCTSKDVWK